MFVCISIEIPHCEDSLLHMFGKNTNIDVISRSIQTCVWGSSEYQSQCMNTLLDLAVLVRVHISNSIKYDVRECNSAASLIGLVIPMWVATTVTVNT